MVHPIFAVFNSSVWTKPLSLIFRPNVRGTLEHKAVVWIKRLHFWPLKDVLNSLNGNHWRQHQQHYHQTRTLWLPTVRLKPIRQPHLILINGSSSVGLPVGFSRKMQNYHGGNWNALQHSKRGYNVRWQNSKNSPNGSWPRIIIRKTI